MGNLFEKFLDIFSTKQARILMLSLPAAGKTTILYKFKLGDVVTTIPTIGFNVETIQYKGLSMTVYDVGGQDKIRPLWRHYFPGTQALIFVIDSNDQDRMEEAIDELQKLVNEDELRDVCVLVLANKQDLPGALSLTEITEKIFSHKEIKENLFLNTEQKRKWKIQTCCAVDGRGIYEAFDWLAAAIKNE